MNNQPYASIEKHPRIKEYMELREVFDQKDESGFTSTHELGIDYKDTEVGTFLPAPTAIIYKLFQDLVSNDFLDPTLPFLDAGSGDARVNHLAALHGVAYSIGIEYAPEVLEKSKRQTQKFEEANIIERGYVRLVQGDFTNIETYTNNNLDVKKFKTFFNYINGWRELFGFVDTNSPVGVKVILIDEQFNTSSRIIEEISKYASIRLVETVKYIQYKHKDTAEVLTPELVKKIKETDNLIDTQTIHLDVSTSGQFSLTETDCRVITVYLLEKVS